MKTILTNRPVSCLGMCALLVFALAPSLHAVPVSLGGGLALPTSMVYMGPDMSPTPMWNVMPSGTFLGSVLDSDASAGSRFRMSVTGFSWTGHALIEDQSTDLSVPAAGPSLASATFAGGGTLSIQGIIFNFAGGGPIYNGSLLEADVTSGFQLRENDINGTVISNIAETIKFEPVSGWLYDNETLQMRGEYELVFNAQEFAPMAGGSLDNFQQSIATIGTGLNVQFRSVPEPASVVLLSLGMCLVRRRRSGFRWL